MKNLNEDQLERLAKMIEASLTGEDLKISDDLNKFVREVEDDDSEVF